MKALAVLLFILPAPASWAQHRVSLQRATSIGLEKIEFVLQKGEWTYRKTTTLFDQKSDLRLGIFKPRSPKKFSEWPEILKTVELTHRKSIELLKSQGAGPDVLSPPLGHSPHAELNGLTIPAATPAYDILTTLLQNQTKEEFDQVEGAALSGDRKEMVFYAAGKPSSKERFEPQHFCTRLGHGLRCAPGKWGHMYLELK
jgi:hypothetical protein